MPWIVATWVLNLRLCCSFENIQDTDWDQIATGSEVDAQILKMLTNAEEETLV